jgi:hypothetical protein
MTKNRSNITPRPRTTVFVVLLIVAILMEIRQNAPSFAPLNEGGVAAAYLRSGRDVPMGKKFKLEPDGTLSEAPTLRIKLLNDLAKTNMPVATKIARDILQEKKSADEWALSLAILTRSDKSATNREYIHLKAQEMALYPPWDPQSANMQNRLASVLGLAAP